MPLYTDGLHLKNNTRVDKEIYIAKLHGELFNMYPDRFTMFLLMSVRQSVCISVCICACVCQSMCIYVSVYESCLYVGLHVCMYDCPSACVHICRSVCVCMICTHVCKLYECMPVMTPHRGHSVISSDSKAPFHD